MSRPPRLDELNPRLFEFRQQRRLTQEQVAEAIGISVEMVRRHEKGLAQPIEKYRLRYSSFYGASQVTLGLMPGNESRAHVPATAPAASRAFESTPELPLESSRQGVNAHASVVKERTGTPGSLAFLGTVTEADRLRRRGLLGSAVSTFTAALMGKLNTDELERFTKALTSPGRVDGRVIDHIEAILRHCKLQEDSLGPHAVLDTVLAQMQMASSLQRGCPAALRPRLLSIYSDMSSSAGYYFFDLGDIESAMLCCDQARAAAQEARNTELAIYALCNMSYFASWQSKAYAGIDFAAAAQSLATQTDDVLLKVCAAERTGTAYAIDGQYKAFMAHFDKAQTLMVHAAAVPPGSPAYWYHQGLVASQKSDCLIRLGKPAKAAIAARDGLRLFDNSFVGSRAFCTLRLGSARLGAGEVEEAARVIGDGALLASRAPSPRLVGEVKAARAGMRPWQDMSAAKELDERLLGMGFVI